MKDYDFIPLTEKYIRQLPCASALLLLSCFLVVPFNWMKNFKVEVFLFSFWIDFFPCHKLVMGLGFAITCLQSAGTVSLSLHATFLSEGSRWGELYCYYYHKKWFLAVVAFLRTWAESYGRRIWGPVVLDKGKMGI